MPTSNQLVEFIGGHEGFVSTYYLDPVHIPTIGYGFTNLSPVFRNWWKSRYGRDMRRGDTISKADALAVLKLIIETEAGPPVERAFGSQRPNVKESAKSTVYNAGAKSLTWRWAQAIQRGDLKGGYSLLRQTATTAKGKKLPGLVRRRGEEADIGEFGRWPAWMKGITYDQAPETHITEEDVRQAQVWLNQLNYQCGTPDGVPGGRTQAAVARFQKDHGTLLVDGKLGPATLAALRRTIDLQAGLAKTVVPATAATAAGGAEVTTNVVPTVDTPVGDTSALGDILLWGGAAVLVLALAYFAWRYRDELVAFLKRL